jgi:hypothetical protein
MNPLVQYVVFYNQPLARQLFMMWNSAGYLRYHERMLLYPNTPQLESLTEYMYKYTTQICWRGVGCRNCVTY